MTLSSCPQCEHNSPSLSVSPQHTGLRAWTNTRPTRRLEEEDGLVAARRPHLVQDQSLWKVTQLQLSKMNTQTPEGLQASLESLSCFRLFTLNPHIRQKTDDWVCWWPLQKFLIMKFYFQRVPPELALAHCQISTTFQPSPPVRNNTMLGFMDAVITLHQNVNLPRRHGNIQRCVEAICERLSRELLQMSDM